jgi:hypothetical protein
MFAGKVSKEGKEIVERREEERTVEQIINKHHRNDANPITIPRIAVISSGKPSPHRESENHASSRSQEQGALLDLWHQVSGAESDDPGPDVQDTIDQRFIGC